MAFGEAKGTAQHAGMDGWIDIEIERHLWHTLTALLIAHTHTHACDNVSIKLLLPARAFHSTVVASFPPPSHAFLLLDRAVHTCCVSLRRACVWPRSIDASRAIIARSPPRTHSIHSVVAGHGAHHCVAARACLASNQSSLEHGNQLPDDHCHGRPSFIHSCMHARAVRYS